MQSVLWSDGGRYLVPLDRVAVSASIISLSAGVRVEWASNDVEILPGDNASLSTINVPLWIQTRFVSAFTYSGTRFTFSVTGSNAKTIYPTTTPIKNRFLITYDGSSNPWKVEHFVLGWATPTKTGNPSWIFSSLNSSVQNAFRTPCAFNSAGSPFGVLSSPGCGGAGVASGNYLDLVGNQFVSASSVTTFPLKRVTTNTGATSERQTSLNPLISILPGGCAILIDFQTGGAKTIPASPCPAWVEIKGLNECPGETIKQCDHGVTRCCFGCVNGRLKLIYSFNKSQ